jgi:hypothetical protein
MMIVGFSPTSIRLVCRVAGQALARPDGRPNQILVPA